MNCLKLETDIKLSVALLFADITTALEMWLGVFEVMAALSWYI